MKQIIITALLVCLATGVSAQHKPTPPKENNMEISDFVSDLSKTQKSKIDNITKRTAKTVDSYRTQLKAVRDSIRTLMDLPDDQSAAVFPLFEREGQLQAEISKEYYRSKVAIDNVLTPDQRRTLKEKMAQQRANHKHDQKPHNGPHKPQKK